MQKNAAFFTSTRKCLQRRRRNFTSGEYGIIYSAEKGTNVADLFNARQGDAKVYYDLVKEHLSKEDECLEIGSASGYFLAYIRDKVKSATGMESHEAMRDYSNKIGVDTKKGFEGLEGKKFDKIFMFFVLEHIGEPVEFFGKLKKHLKEGGKLFIEVPNVRDALLELYKVPAFPEFYFTPAHVYYYSKDTLAKMLAKAGFEKYEIKEFQRYDISNHINWMMNGKPGGAGKYDAVFSMEMREEYKRCLERNKTCDGLLAIIEG